MKSYETSIKQLEQLLVAGVSPFHTILDAASRLDEAGFQALPMGDPWSLKHGQSYYVNAYDSTLIAFTIPQATDSVPRIRIAASHTDWPCLKVKPCPEVVTKSYGKLNVEVYGGPILSTWMDRPLSMAGKVCVTGEDPFCPTTIFVDFKRPLLTIPNLAIHLNREVNKGVELNPQEDMLPLITMVSQELNKEHYFLSMLAEEVGYPMDQILDYEFCIYSCDQPALLGIHNEFYSAPRLDNLTSVAACLQGVIHGNRTHTVNIAALYDNEEIGSSTKQGANSSLLDHIMEKIYLCLGYSRSQYIDSLFGGFFLSIDVAHAFHPNKSKNYDIKNHVFLNDGVVIKLASSQSYATDASAASVIEALCKKEGIPYKKFSNRSNIKGGSTLGSISSAKLTIKTVDIGVPLLAMHASRELMGVQDQHALDRLVIAYFQ